MACLNLINKYGDGLLQISSFFWIAFQEADQVQQQGSHYIVEMIGGNKISDPIHYAPLQFCTSDSGIRTLMVLRRWVVKDAATTLWRSNLLQKECRKSTSSAPRLQAASKH